MIDEATLKRNYKTIENAIINGMNNGVFGFLSVKNNEPIFYKWRLMGDCVEIKKSNKARDKWEVFNEKNIKSGFDIGVYGEKFDWSLPIQMSETITER